MIERQKRAAAGVLAFVLLNAPAALRAQTGSSPRSNEHWVTTWATAQQLAPTRLPFGRGELVQPPPAARVPATLKDQTVRMIAHASLGGRRVRVSLANALEKPTLRVGAAHIALRANGAAIVPASDRALTFGGRPSTVVPPGTMVVSDPVDLAVPALADLAVSVYLPEETGLPTVHPDGMHTAYITRGQRDRQRGIEGRRDDDRVSLARERRRAGAGRRRRASSRSATRSPTASARRSTAIAPGRRCSRRRWRPAVPPARGASSTSGCREIACCGRGSA